MQERALESTLDYSIPELQDVLRLAISGKEIDQMLALIKLGRVLPKLSELEFYHQAYQFFGNLANKFENGIYPPFLSPSPEEREKYAQSLRSTAEECYKCYQELKPKPFLETVRRFSRNVLTNSFR